MLSVCICEGQGRVENYRPYIVCRVPGPKGAPKGPEEASSGPIKASRGPLMGPGCSIHGPEHGSSSNVKSV